MILGAGRVGESVAESLVSERNDITVIDPDPQRLRELEERLDLRGVPGNGIHAQVLERAGGQDADMLIACATRDETNLVACKIAHDVFQIPSTIARLRGSEFKEGDPLLGKGGFSVDHVICPEESLVKYVQKLIDYPEALQVLEFAEGRALLIAVRAAHGSPLVDHTIAELRQLCRRRPCGWWRCTATSGRSPARAARGSWPATRSSWPADADTSAPCCAPCTPRTGRCAG